MLTLCTNFVLQNHCGIAHTAFTMFCYLGSKPMYFTLWALNAPIDANFNCYKCLYCKSRLIEFLTHLCLLDYAYCVQ